MSNRFVRGDFVLVPSIKGLKGLSPIAQVVYMWLAYHSDAETGECFPSYSLLEEETTYSKPSLIKAVKILEEKGLIKKIIRKKKNSKENTSNLYILLSLGSKGGLPPSKGGLPPSKGGLPPSKGGLPELESLNLNHINKKNKENSFSLKHNYDLIREQENIEIDRTVASTDLFVRETTKRKPMLSRQQIKELLEKD
jgi:DNA-binding MarR family transcriptional regulator